MPPPTSEEIRDLVRRVCEVPYDRWLAEVKRQNDEHFANAALRRVPVESPDQPAVPWARMDPAAVAYRARFGL